MNYCYYEVRERVKYNITPFNISNADPFGVGIFECY